MLKSTQHFYEKLTAQRIPLSTLMKDVRLFKKVPDTWFVVVTDITGSTNAVALGKHNDVNLAATGTIIAVLNKIRDLNKTYKIPYFFGGDGATFIIPQQVHTQVMQVLENYQAHIKKTLSLDLRVGEVSVKKIYEDGNMLKLAKVRLNDYLTVPVVLGAGLKYAESFIKDQHPEKEPVVKEASPVNLTGMECRWDEIQPLTNTKKVICLLVTSTLESDQPKVYGAVLDRIHKIFGNFQQRQPISTPRLVLNTTISKIKKEMYARVGKYNWTYLVKNWIITGFGKYYFKLFKDGKEYLQKVSQLSDTLMIDGSINTVMEGDEAQIKKLTNYLDAKEKQGVLTYGIHITYASIMSCYVQDRKENHIHFVDGTEGGYTSAAKVYKEKLQLT